MESSDNIDEIIIQNNDTNRKRFTITDAQLARFKQIIGQMEDASDQPACWHELAKQVHEGSFEEFKDASIFFCKAPLTWSNDVYVDKSWNYFSLVRYD